ncbi:MAG: DUF3373 family protein [Aliarcobacter sp.]|jgi:hypothetical protein|nr:DUF3373 family protein [Aliarcobacter sp.]
MKKNLIALSCVAAFATTSFSSDVNTEMFKQIQALKAQIEALEKKVAAQETVQVQKVEPAVTTVDEKRIEKIEKKLDTVSKTATAAKVQSAQDNLKWDVDFRTQVDNIQYKHADGSKSENNALLTNRLWLGAKYKADDNSSFFGKLSYNKAFGDTANHSQSNVNTTGYSNFDWVTNENATDNTLKVKEAYWLYSNETFLGTNVPWNASVGRRPSTDGLPINIRNDQKANSPLSHVVDVEFDGFSVRFDTENLTGLTGSWFKICGGRGLTNAIPRFDSNPTNSSIAYAEDNSKNVDIDMLGFIAVPYDNSQYSIHTNYAKAWNLIGFNGTSPDFKDVGDMDFATILFKTEGIGNGISDYLDNTVAFASFAVSKTNPNGNNGGMLGELDSEVGTSVWLGVNAPCPILPDSAKIGFEWNQGSKFWRSMTYGEDTYAGSKIATRGQAWEVYRTQKLTNALSFGVSYVLMQYDYTGSNSFFGADGTPMTLAEAGDKAVKEAQDVRAYMRYRF